jgi:Zn-dependent protease with chaperone function
MAVSLDSSPADRVSQAGEPMAACASRPADRASRRLFRVSAVLGLLGLLGLASFALVFLRLGEDWHVTPSASRHVSIFGQRLSYPVANAAAVMIVVLAALGAIVTVIAVWAITKEVLAARALKARLVALRPSHQDGVWVLDDEHPEAFCAGLLRPRVYVTSGALAALDGPGLDAVLLHERHHASRRDPLRLAATRVLARSLFFLPALGDLREGQRLLVELGADERAVRGAGGDRSALAQAMLSFSDASEPAGMTRIDPARVDALLGEPPAWRFPTFMSLAATALLAVIVTLAILVGREAAGTATLAPPFLSAQPCIVMLALMPCLVALLVTQLVRSLRKRDRPTRRL